MLTDKDRERARERNRRRERGRERAREREKLREDTSRRGADRPCTSYFFCSFFLALSFEYTIFAPETRRKAQIYKGLLSFPFAAGQECDVAQREQGSFQEGRETRRVLPRNHRWNSFLLYLRRTRFTSTAKSAIRSGSAEKEQAFIRASFSRAR